MATMPDATDTCREIALEEKVACLRRRESYIPPPEAVDVVETHMSWVFLTDALVYKMKKPVRYDFLDFATLEARRLDCQREVELNQRLAADVYRGTVPLTMRGDGGLQLGGAGTVVEWLVEMRRLPADRMLDAAIRAGAVRDEAIAKLSAVLTDFYRSASRVAITPHDYRERFAAGIRDNQSELAKPGYGLATDAIDALAASQQRFLQRRGGLVEERARQGKIVDAHGDLRPEHICLTPEPRIIDCLEFKREFRLLDPVDELSYLAMECERVGGGAVGAGILARYLDATGECIAPELIAFYKTFRAFVRARIAIAHIADHTVNDTEKWRRRANEYLALSAFHAKAI